jgi:DeoR family fructose operon transcriptional repressor
MGKQLIPAQRHARIRERLEIDKVLNNADLTALLGVSEATIRRDLEWLEGQGILERTHGGAVQSKRMKLEPEYSARALSHPEEKRSIGGVAAGLIEEGDTVFVSSGTTTAEVIRHMPRGVRFTVITNNLSAVLEFQNGAYELILLGGAFNSHSNTVTGRFATENLRQVFASKTFIGVDGFSLKYGCTVPGNADAELARLMIERTRGQVIVVADHSKWGVVSNFEAARWDQIQTLVTDEALDARARAELMSRNIQLLVADAMPAQNGNGKSAQ